MDTVADTLTIIRNGYMARKKRVGVRVSRMNRLVLESLEKNNFISSFEETEGEYVVKLKYVNAPDSLEKIPVLRGIQRISKPGLRVYKPYSSIPRVMGGLGVVLVSTSKGIMSDKEARKNKLGGELICKVW